MKAHEKRERILHLMKISGACLDIRGVKVRRNFVRDPHRVQSFVSPPLSSNPSAYEAWVGGVRVDIHAAKHLLETRAVLMRRRGWKIRVRCYLPEAQR